MPRRETNASRDGAAAAQLLAHGHSRASVEFVAPFSFPWLPREWNP